MSCFLLKKLFNPRIAKFLKRTMCLILAAFVLIPAISYSMSNDFVSANAVGTYETVGVGKKLVDCFPGEDRIFARYVYRYVLYKFNQNTEAENYENYILDDRDVKVIENHGAIDISGEYWLDITGIQNFTSLASLRVSENMFHSLPSDILAWCTSRRDSLPAPPPILFGRIIPLLPEQLAGITYFPNRQTWPVLPIGYPARLPYLPNNHAWPNPALGYPVELIALP